MFKRSVLSSAIVLAGSVWGSAALANTDSDAQFSSADEINKVSEWMGKEVQDNQGNDVGSISDFALKLEDGSIVYAVIELEGMFNSEAIAVPLSALSTSEEGEDGLTLQVSQSEWKSAETFSGGDWPLQASLATDGAAITSMTADENPGASETADSGRRESENEYGQAEDEYGQTEGQHGQSSSAVTGVNQGGEFNSLDTDGDGYLSSQEYQAATGTTANEGADQDEDGRISRSEFAAFETAERESAMQKKSSTDDHRYEEGSADQSHDSQGTDD